VTRSVQILILLVTLLSTATAQSVSSSHAGLQATFAASNGHVIELNIRTDPTTMDLRSPTFESATMRGSGIISASGFLQKSYQCYTTRTYGWFSTLPRNTCFTMPILRASSGFILGRRLHSIFGVFSMTGILKCLVLMRRNIALPVLTLWLRAASDCDFE
jgi:hypothetical protein